MRSTGWWTRRGVAIVGVAVLGAGAAAGAVRATSARPDAGALQHATKVSVHAGQTTSHVDAALTDGAAIAGQVTDVSANPLSFANVSVQTFSGRTLGYSTTDSNGNYRITSLPPVNLRHGFAVCVTAEYASNGVSAEPYGYVGQCNGSNRPWYSYLHPSSDARRVPTSAGETSSASFQLSPAGGIGGSLTSLSGHRPLTYATAYAYSAAGQQLAGAAVGSDGLYTIRGLAPGTYRVCFTAPSGDSASRYGYVPRCFHHVAWRAYSKPPKTAAPVSVTAEHATTVEEYEPDAGAIAGAVHSAARPYGPVSYTSVSAFDAQGNSVGYAYADRNGFYRIDSLPAGSYRVCAEGSFRPQLVLTAPSAASARPLAAPAGVSYGNQCWKHVAWTTRALPKGTTPVHVSSGGVTRGITFALPRHVSHTGIAGRVTNRSGAGIAGVEVTAFIPHQDIGGVTTTGPRGSYTIAVPSSSKGYTVCFRAPRPNDTLVAHAAQQTRYGSECWKDRPWTGGGSPGRLSSVTVTQGRVHRGIGAVLPLAGTISGTARYQGQPVPNVSVSVLDSAKRSVGYAYTDDNGRYSVPGLSPLEHAYYVCFSTGFADPTANPQYGYRNQCFRNQNAGP